MQPDQNTTSPNPQLKNSTFLLEAYDYDLPESLIAQAPSEYRDASRLMALDRKKGSLYVGQITDIVHLLPARSLLVVNNSRVIPGRLRTANKQGGNMEMLLLTPLAVLHQHQRREGNQIRVTADILIRPAKRARPGKTFQFGSLAVTILSKKDFGKAHAELYWDSHDTLENILLTSGEIPLPPYIRRPPDLQDQERYQTTYASVNEIGSIAAPTAGLHFTAQLRKNLLQAGHAWTEITLYVGYGTFSPIREQDIRQHQMHAEYVKVSQEAATAIHQAKQSGRPVVAVGTTSLRTLEGVHQLKGAVTPYEGWLDTYIYPGFAFHIVDGLLTNFHLPKSSLLVLVSAFAGREQILAAYRRAVAERFRFFSYGDAMFIY
ncbi:MAG: tRNA preQ1(34) S-adenosylmethionine ribosyltransferase-isomerase QueA [Desulfovibrionales bacterium]|nr:MAG: tRNA preQ1(34) S-adenosylmethionine ribosyltransferase-isomerase QueA [Desulfovibrionales bacterium]